MEQMEKEGVGSLYSRLESLYGMLVETHGYGTAKQQAIEVRASKSEDGRTRVLVDERLNGKVISAYEIMPDDTFQLVTTENEKASLGQKEIFDTVMKLIERYEKHREKQAGN